MMQLNCQSLYLVTRDFKHCMVNVYKDDFINFREPFLVIKASNPLSVFEGQRYVPRMSESWPDCDSTLLVSCGKKEYVYISAYEIVKFTMEDKTIDFISYIDSNMHACTIAIGEEYTFYISKHYKFIKNDVMEEGSLFNFFTTSYDPFDYHFEKCGEISFTEMN